LSANESAAAAVAEKLKELEDERLKNSMIEGYKARQAEDAEVNRDWEGTSLEERPR
jgi:hypothetical protein